jgi:hypothetical protein
VNEQQRQKTALILRRRPEVQIAIRALFDVHINNLKMDKLGSLFSFLVKS